MEIAKIVGVGIISLILIMTMRRQNAEYALLISIAASCIIFFMIMPFLGQAIGVLENISALMSTSTQYIGLILKIIAIAYIAEFGAQICVDAGESAIASKIELGGKALILITSTPILFGLINLINAIMP
ncbi:MAG: stage III sporulation protein AD [Clostridiales bacterium]|jgi:stage III sporulation protein AD|nr:stage III sporulation protein AD [Clostridiales bacterium]